MAGHNKWKQIKHKKAATDAKRGATFGKTARAITAAVCAAGGNTEAVQVCALIERAKHINMSKEIIERALAKGAGGEGAADACLTFETFGVGGIAIIICTTTDSRNRTVQEMKHLLSEHGTTLGATGSAQWAFNKLDEVYTPKSTVGVTDDTADALALLIDALEGHDDVDAVYTNAENL